MTDERDERYGALHLRHFAGSRAQQETSARPTTRAFTLVMCGAPSGPFLGSIGVAKLGGRAATAE